MKILIVDDEPGSAAGLAQWLEANGWGAPGVATTADDAVTWINQNGGIDVLVSNVYMQPTDGFTLRETIQPHYPAMRTVFLTAYDLSAYASRIAGAAVLSKPASGEALDGAIRRLFEPRAAAVATATAPKVVAQSTPRAVATAKPATPAVQAKPVAVAAVAKAAVAATPTARPVAAAASPQAVPSSPTPKPAVAAVAATPRPAATATPKPAVAAAPTATPAHVPVAAKVPAPAAARPASPKPAAKAPGEVEVAPDEYVGTAIGNYQIEAKIGQGTAGGIYRALQTNIGRQVRFYILDPQLAQSAESVQSFIANASVKANVSHPYILAVYEAGQSGGVYFYSCEYIPCRSLKQIIEAGDSLQENVALQTMKTVAETLGYFEQNKIAHNLISENSILIASNNKPRMANIAAFQPPEAMDIKREMTSLGRVISAVLPENSQALGIRKFAVDLASGAVEFSTWQELIQTIVGMEPKIAPQDAYKLDAQERAAIRMVEEARKRQRRSMIVSTLVSLCLLGSLLGGGYYIYYRLSGGQGKEFNTMLEIPEGEFIYQDGQKVTLPKFYIDEYEVTIAQYAKFLEYLEAHPEAAESLSHPEQPKGKSHVPAGWADDSTILGYYARAKGWRKFHDAHLDVNSPVFGVDWFDAYAYAKWKGRRLPTEQEWEKAARGTQGFAYPWGNEADPKRANTGADYNPDPSKGGEVDGWDRSSPVDAMSKDISAYRVKDMAGNVSEWTATMVDDPMLGGQKVPVVRGGNWRRANEYMITRRVLTLPALKPEEVLGFRTVSDTPPETKK